MILTDLIKRFEGLRLRAYLCPAGIPTIGYGATGPDVRLGEDWTQEKADARLVRDSTNARVATLRLCPQLVGLENKLTAISDFTFNLGPTRLAGSTLRRRIRARQWNLAANEITRWVYGGGRALPGLVLRRRVERQLFIGAIR